MEGLSLLDIAGIAGAAGAAYALGYGLVQLGINVVLSHIIVRRNNTTVEKLQAFQQQLKAIQRQQESQAGDVRPGEYL